jgi:hypothetical protein
MGKNESQTHPLLFIENCRLWNEGYFIYQALIMPSVILFDNWMYWALVIYTFFGILSYLKILTTTLNRPSCNVQVLRAPRNQALRHNAWYPRMCRDISPRHTSRAAEPPETRRCDTMLDIRERAGTYPLTTPVELRSPHPDCISGCCGVPNNGGGGDFSTNRWKLCYVINYFNLTAGPKPYLVKAVGHTTRTNGKPQTWALLRA